MEDRMKRLQLALVFAGGMMFGAPSVGLAQTSTTPNAQPQTTQTQSTQPMSPGAGAPAAARNPAKTQKKAQRVAARGDCRAQGKQQSLTGQGLRDFVKSCMARHN
jgi:hypothetical protein